MCVCVLSHVRLLETPWAAACQAALSMEFSRQEYWSGLPLPPPRDLPDPGIEPTSPVSCTAGRFFTTEPPGKPRRLPIQSERSLWLHSVSAVASYQLKYAVKTRKLTSVQPIDSIPISPVLHTLCVCVCVCVCVCMYVCV